MSIRLLTTEDDLQEYDRWIHSHPQGNLWQSLEYKRFSEALGRTVHIYISDDGDRIVSSALVVVDRTSLGLSTWEIPRGPIGEGRGSLLATIQDDSKKDRCLSLLLS